MQTTTTINPDLLAAYRMFRQRIHGRAGYWEVITAASALDLARRDVAAGKKRYPASRTGIQFNPAATEGADIGARWVEHAAPSLRFAGYADELAGRSVDHKGWYRDTFQDGTLRGAVYLLPGRNGETLAVPGYADPCNDGAAFLDFGNIQRDIDGDAAKRSAALAADSLAERHAESEREYDTAWQAGSQWSDKGAEIAEARKAALADLATRRTIRADMSRVGVPLDSREWRRACAMVADRVRQAIDTIAELRAEREKLASGDYDSLIFYPSPALRDAFNEGAGQTVLA